MPRTKNDNDGPRKGRSSGLSLSPAIEQQINENLKKLYQDAAEEPVPDHLMQLLEKLKQQGGKQ